MNILFLTLRTFSSTGGIEKVGRGLAKALADFHQENEIDQYHVSSMYDDQPNTQYITPVNFSGFKGNRISFALNTLVKSKSTNIIILSHINLLLFAWMIKKIFPQKRVIIMAHGIEIWGKIKQWKLSFLKEKCEVWAVSEFTRQQLIAKEIPASQIKVLNNCLDPFFETNQNFEKPQYLLERYQLNANQPILFTLARLSSAEQYKGYDQVLMALKNIINSNPNFHYILAGKADELEKTRITAMIEANGLTKHVTLTDFLDETEVNDHYRLADIFLMPSKGEGFGISFIEAAAAGCHVIAGNKDGSTDALLNGDLGTLINPDNLTALTNAINHQLMGRKEKSILIQTKCLKYFSYGKYKKNVLDLLTSHRLQKTRELYT